MHGSLSLNVQTNSSNYGFNPYSKHKRFDYLSIDLRGARVAFHDRHSSALDLFKRIHVDKLNVSITLGKNGSYCHALKQEAFMPAFAESVKDATGAGDAYFGLTSLFVHVGAHPCLVAFVGNVFAGLKTKIIGNKSAVSKMELLLALKEVLE
jgi:sugar/nucleoside kinase (ribokinase family)